MAPTRWNSRRPSLGLVLAAGCAVGGAPAGRGGHGSDARAEDPRRRDGAVVADEGFELVAPSDGEAFARSDVAGHRWVARVPVRAEGAGLERLELRVASEGVAAAVRRAPFETDLVLHGLGAHELVVSGHDARGRRLGLARRVVEVVPAPDESCPGMLDALGVPWAPGPALRGVAFSVVVGPELGGVRYFAAVRGVEAALPMDCELAPRLVELGRLVRPWGVTRVEHLGVYNYRCVDGGDPDEEECRLSAHARGRAIDVSGLALSDGRRYDVSRDWSSGPPRTACERAVVGAPARVLRDAACAAYADGVFEVVLTPDFDAAHRSHLHLELDAGRTLLRVRREGVDPPGYGDR